MIRCAAPAILLSALVVVAYGRFVGEYFQGGDIWPHIWTTRVTTLDDVVGVLSQPIMSGTVFPSTVALFFRPLSSLSYSLNYAVWGVNSVAFHVTDLVVHECAALALYALAVVLGLRRWAAAIGVGVFALHPVMVSVVPSLPRRHDSLAAACLFAALAVAAYSLKQRSMRQVTLGAGAAGLLALAELAKEIGYLGLLLAPLTLVAAARATDLPRAASARRIATILAVMAGLSVAMLAWRWIVLDGLGGYYDRIPPLANLEVDMHDVLRNLLFPFYELLDRSRRAMLTETGLALLVAGVPALLVSRRAANVIVFGWCWLLIAAGFQLATKSLAAWQTYVTVASLAFLAGGVLDGASEVLSGRAHVVRKATLGLCAAGVVIFVGATVRSSALLRPFDEWHIAGEVGRLYLNSLRACLEAAPPGMPVVVMEAPDSIQATTPERELIHPGILGPYSVAPAVALVMPEISPQELTTAPLVRVREMPREINSRCRIDDEKWVIRTDYSY